MSGDQAPGGMGVLGQISVGPQVSVGQTAANKGVIEAPPVPVSAGSCVWPLGNEAQGQAASVSL